MRTYRQVYSRTKRSEKRQKRSVSRFALAALIGIGLADGLTVGVLQASPASAVALANLISYNTNALGNRQTTKIYTHVDQSKLTQLQKQQVTFTDNNYVSSMNSLTDYLGNTSALYLQGYVAVPNVGISEPIYYGTSNTALANGAGTAKDNQVMGQGNYAISAHNMGSYVNWKVPVPAVAGGYINPGSYFTALQLQTPTYIYTTDGQNIYTYKEASREVTNVGNGNVLSDSYAYDDAYYNYDVRDEDGQATGNTDTSVGLGLGGGNNTSEAVGSYKLSTLVADKDVKTTYVVNYQTKYRYASKLDADNFKIEVVTGDTTIKGVSAKVSKVAYKNGTLAVSFKFKGDLATAAATVGAKVVLKQLQNNAFVTLTTCVVPGTGGASADRIINTGKLVKVTAFDKAPAKLQKLFPALLKTSVQTVDVSQTGTSADETRVQGLGDITLTPWQKVLQTIGNVLLAQSDWLTKHL